MLFIKLFKESAFFAWGSVVANKLRTLLTLLGITIGIFAIISVFSVVDALEKSIRGSIASLGENVVYIQKWPWEFGSDYPWWRYINRPTPRVSELDEIMRRTQILDAVVFTASTSRTVEFGNRSMERITILTASHDYDKIRSFEIGNGRYFSPTESFNGRNVALIGANIAQNLFNEVDPVGKIIKIFGRNIEVIGVFTQEGDDIFGNSHDDLVLLPVTFVNSFIDVNSDRYNPAILAKGRENFDNDELIDELRGTMRSIRRIKPTADDNFALNQASLLSTQFDNVFSVLKIAGWIIGGFSILVGGFGIANIMFVSVKERTNIIGIQKALGAKNYFILFQFLTEAVLLSLMGGIIGLVMVFGISWLATSILGMNLMLSMKNIMLGINVSVIIGLIAGFVPAWSAARLDPVEAIRTGL
ncbi:MAG: FtsX-like permease family protein [Bacteroidetes bacterium]|nr:MAG: FtsX-like permease family protein [Bacteroidota bacterium]